MKTHRLLFAIAPALAVLCSLCGWFERPNLPMRLSKSATLDLYVVSPTNVPNSRKDTNPATGNAIFLLTPPVISAKDVAVVQRSEDSDGTPPALTVQLTSAGATKLGAATTQAVGQHVAIVANGEVISVPRLQSPLSNSFVVTGDWNANEFDRLFDALTGP